MSDRLEDGSAEARWSARLCRRFSWRRAETFTGWPERSAVTWSGWDRSGSTSATTRPRLRTTMRSRAGTSGRRRGRRTALSSLLGEAGRQVLDLRRLGDAERGGGLVQDEQFWAVRAWLGPPPPVASGRATGCRRGRRCLAVGYSVGRGWRRRRYATGWPRTSSGATRPRSRLAATSRLSQRARSCQTTATPLRLAATGQVGRDGLAREVISPVAGAMAPDAADQGRLPAPFSPASATTSPRRTLRLIPSRAPPGRSSRSARTRSRSAAPVAPRAVAAGAVASGPVASGPVTWAGSALRRRLCRRRARSCRHCGPDPRAWPQFSPARRADQVVPRFLYIT